MNKAFVKEQEDAGNRCPKCGSPGQIVYEATLAAHVPAELRADFSNTAYFCPHETCTVAYFDQLERVIPAEGLTHAVYPKDPDAPICPCFGLTCDEIEADARAGDVERIREHLRRAQSDEARCATLAPDGQSCIARVQKHYMQSRAR
jgi:hypothetical protein